MIRHISKEEAAGLDPSLLVGMIVFRGGQEIWPSVRWPVKVIGHRGPNGHKLIVRPVPYQFVPEDEDGPAFHNYRGDWEQAETTFTLLAIRAMCDTPQEAMRLLDQGHRAEQSFHRWYARELRKLHHLTPKRDWLVLKKYPIPKPQ